jgi:hypothetical protein
MGTNHVLVQGTPGLTHLRVKRPPLPLKAVAHGTVYFSYVNDLFCEKTKIMLGHVNNRHWHGGAKRRFDCGRRKCLTSFVQENRGKMFASAQGAAQNASRP